VAEGLSAPAYVNSVKEDPARRGLLYAGTELGAAVSFDSGDHWQSLQLNLPAVSVRDLAVHGDDLVIATFGRGFWILDGIGPLRQADERIAASEVALLRPATAVRVNPEEFNGTPIPPEEPQAKNPPDGVAIDYYLKSAAPGEVVLEILDAKGDVVRKVSSQDRVVARAPGAVADIWYPAPQRLTGKAGMNRFVWDLRYAATGAEDPESALGRPVQGPLVLPGNYTVRLTVAGRSQTQPLRVTMDPRSMATPEELQKQFELSIAIWRDLMRAAELSRTGGATIASVMSRLGAALAVAESADRTPPATAYQMAAAARKDLAGMLGK
jgi:hypothetical protein